METSTNTTPGNTLRLFWLILAALGLGLSIAAPLKTMTWENGAPDMAQWIGRFHPFVLHFPIVLLIVALAFEAARLPGLRRILPRPDATTVTSVLAWGAVGCTFAVVCGWLLAQSGGYEKELLDRHLWSGSVVGIGANLALILRLCSCNIGAGLMAGISNATLAATCVVMTFAGHYGANLTHGETYLTDHAPNFVRQLAGLKPKRDPNSIEIKPVEQRLLWEDVVSPSWRSAATPATMPENQKVACVSTPWPSCSREARPVPRSSLASRRTACFWSASTLGLRTRSTCRRRANPR